MFGIARRRAVDNFDLYSEMLKSQILLMMHTIDQIYAHKLLYIEFSLKLEWYSIFGENSTQNSLLDNERISLSTVARKLWLPDFVHFQQPP